jgi:DNA-binding beta-propeller fold protein YncE
MQHTILHTGVSTVYGNTSLALFFARLAVSVNPSTNISYVVNRGDSTVSVINSESIAVY